MSAPLLVVAAGGTGGHMFPAQALTEEMLARGWRVALSTDARGERYADGFPDAVERRVVSSATFARGGLVSKLVSPLKIAGGVLASVRSFRADKPACVAGFGGYPAIPAMSAARVLGLPRLIHEQNGVPGRVNRLFARHVGCVACGMWPTVLPAGAVARYIGNPVRAAIAAHAGAPYPALESADPIHILVIGGSQGARILSDHVPGAIAALETGLRARVHVAQQARAEDVARVEDAYAEAGIKAEIAPFFADVPDRLVQSHLVISRAGASSVADLAAIGRPSILIPFAAAMDDHQSANAQTLGAVGAAEIVAESALTPDRLSTHIASILGDPAQAARMAARARDAGRPDAAGRLADLVETLAAGKSVP